MDSLTGHKWATYNARERYARDLKKPYRVDISGVVPAPTYVGAKSTAGKKGALKNVGGKERAAAQAVLRKLEEAEERGDYVAIDTEFDPDTGELYTWQLSTGDNRVVIDHRSGATDSFRRWLASDAPKVFHHAYADVPVFRRNRIALGGIAADTIVLDWLIDENRLRHGLKVCARDWLGIPLVDYEDAFGYVPKGKKKRVVPHLRDIIAQQFDRFVEYASLDAYATYWLFQHHRRVVENLKLWDYYLEHEVPFTLTLCAMRERSIVLDKPVLLDIGEKLDATMSRMRHLFREVAPSIKVERTRLGEAYYETIEPERISLRSPQQLSALFYDTLGCVTIRKNKRTGRPDPTCRSTDVEHLTAWSNQGVLVADLILEHRKAATQRGTFVGSEGGKGLLAHVKPDPRDHKLVVVTTNLHQIGTVTGRLASREPNLQNIPARKEKDPYRMRRAFVARPGSKIIVADYSGAELRVMAHMSQDENMLAAFDKGLDLHSVTAKNIFGFKCSLDEVKKLHPDERNAAKAINFGLQYGMKAFLLAKQIGVDIDTAQAYINAYFDLYDGVYLWMLRTVRDCERRGYVTTILGRRRRVPDINLEWGETTKGKINHARNQAMNTPIQGSVADIIKVAMNDVESDQYLKDCEAELLLQVHDELIVEAPELTAWEAKARLEKLMEEAALKCGMTVRLPAEGGVGDNWEEAKV